jgi:hypothetical protein
MSYTYKIIGQSAPAAVTNTNIYTVGTGKQAIISTIVIANRAATGASYRIAVRPAGDTLANLHYIAYDVTIAALDTLTLTLGITLATTDVVTVYASTATMSFGLYGVENS